MQHLKIHDYRYYLEDTGTRKRPRWKAITHSGEEVVFETQQAAEWFLKLDNDHKEWMERKNADGHNREASGNQDRAAWRRF